MVWSTAMEQAVRGLKDEKVSLSVLVVVVFLGYQMWVWADGEHNGLVERSDFDQLKTLMVNHTEEYRINNASQIIRDLKTDLRIAKATAAPDIEVNRLEEELEHAEEYKVCLVRRQPNCEHLRDVE
jgi:hypothetical protein